MSTKLIKTEDYLLLIDEKAEMKEGKTFITKDNIIHSNYGYNYGDRVVIAYYPLIDEAKELDLPLLPNPFEEEVNIEKLAINSFGHKPTKDDNDIILSLGKGYVRGFQEGYKAAQSDKQFSLEDMIAFGKKCFYKGFDKSENDDANPFTAWREECSKLIQSLSTQKLPKEFIPEYQKDWEETTKMLMESMGDNPEDFKYEETLKTITNSKCKEELVGTYKY